MAGGGSSKSTSTPVDLTPDVFKLLQTPLASSIGSLLGWQMQVAPGSGTGRTGTTGTTGRTTTPRTGGTATGGSGVTTVTTQPNKPPKLGTGNLPLRDLGGGQWKDQITGEIFNTSGQSVSGPTNGRFTGGGYNQMGREVPESGANGNPNAGIGGRTTTTGTGTPGGTVNPISVLFNAIGDPNDPLRGIPKWQGPLTAGMTDNQKALLEQLMKFQGQTGNPLSGSDAVAEQYITNLLKGGNRNPLETVRGDVNTAELTQFAKMLQAASQTTGYSPDQNNPFVKAAIEAAQRPTMEALTETLSRTLPGRFTQAGQMVQPQGSSAFDRAAAIAARGANQTAADIASKISFDAFEAERGRQFTAQENARGREATAFENLFTRRATEQEGARDRNLTRDEEYRKRQLDAITRLTDLKKNAADINTQQIETTIKNLQAQALPQLIEQMGIDKGMEEFQKRTETLLNVLGITAGVTRPVIGQQETSKSNQKPNIMPLFGG